MHSRKQEATSITTAAVVNYANHNLLVGPAEHILEHDEMQFNQHPFQHLLQNELFSNHRSDDLSSSSVAAATTMSYAYSSLPFTVRINIFI